MAQYKTFASQGSFNDFKIVVPDETSKILEQGRQQAEGRRRVQQQIEANQELIGRDMKNYQNLESSLKNANFDLQSMERDQYRQALQRNHDITMRNLKGEANVASAAPLPATLPQPKKSNLYQDLAAFSQAAGAVAQSFIQEQKKLDSANKNYIAMAAGLNFQDLQTITKIDQKLTRAEFNQLDFIQQKINSGASSEQVNALYLVHQQSGSKAWAEAKSTLQNSALGYAPAIQKALDQLPVDSNFNKIDATIEAATAEFISTAFAGARPEVLEVSGIYKQLRQQANDIRSGYYKRSSEVTQNNLKVAQLNGLNSLYYNGGIQAVHAELRTNPSADKRIMAFDWMINSLKSGNIPAEEGYKFLNMRYEFNGNKEMTLAKQFNGFDEVSKLNAAIKFARNAEAADYAFAENSAKQAFVNNQIKRFNELSVGGYTQKEHDLLVEEAAARFPGESFKHLTQFESNLDDVRASKVIHNQWESRFERSGIPPTIEEITKLTKLNPQTQNYWLNKRRLYDSIQPDLKASKSQISGQVLSDPKLTGKTKQNLPWSVSEYIERKQQKFEKLVAGNKENIAQAEIQIRNEIAADLSKPNAFNRGELTIIMDELSKNQQDTLQLEQRQKFLKSIKNKGKVDYNDLEKNLGSEFFEDLGKSLQSNTGVSSFAKYVASSLRTNPLAIYNDWAITTNKAEPITSTSKWNQIVENLPAIRKRELNTFSHIGERQARALNGSRGAAVRTSFVPKSEQEAYGNLLALIRSGEGTYTSANRGRAGDTPGGVPGLNEMTAGKWKQLQAQGYFALGAYQFIPETFRGALNRLKLPDTTIMSNEVQDLLAIELISGGSKRPILAGYLNGSNNNLEGALRDLANEWAAVATAGGSSAYAGVAGNAASIGYDAARKALMDLRSLITQ